MAPNPGCTACPLRAWVTVTPESMPRSVGEVLKETAFLGDTFLFLQLSEVFCSSCWESIGFPFGPTWEHIPLFFPCVHVNLFKI